jgi:inhibitor of cysteine peptidase
MFKNILLILVIFLCLLAATGSLLLGPASQRLTTDDMGTTVLLNTGDDLLVTLEGNPGTGYMWQMVPHDDALLEQAGEPQFNTESELAGSPGKIMLRFKAVAIGKQLITLFYNRPWEADAEPLDTFEFTVIVE